MQLRYAIILGCMILCGPGFDLYDFAMDVPRPLWDDIIIYCKDIQVLGIAILGCWCVPYDNIKPKSALFMIAVWRILIIMINALGCNPVLSPIIVISLNLIYAYWLYRMVSMKPIKSEDPPPQYAYYVLRPIHSIWGLFQAVFLPWYHPLYETRIIAQGNDVWLIYRETFRKMEARLTNIFLKGTKVSLRRTLSSKEKRHLDSLIGKKSIPGIRDCRKFVV